MSGGETVKRARIILAILLISSFALPPSASANQMVHAPIKIIGNSGLGIGCMPNVLNGVSSGCGTASSPYIIENWVIDGSITPDPYSDLLNDFGGNRRGGIYVEATSAYLVIRNVTVKNFNDVQIRISAASNLVIENVLVQTPTAGFIRLGIQMEGGTNNVIRNATAICTGSGFVLGIETYGTFHRVAGNSVAGCSTGISVTDGPGVVVEDNLVDASKTGIAIGASNVLASRNTITGAVSRGISFAGPYSNVSISHNLVTGNSGVGIYDFGMGANVSDNVISYNTGGGLNAGDHWSTYAGNNIFGNGAYGARASDSIAVDLRNNWWGHSSGPNGLGSGSGDALIKGSSAAMPLWDPWLASENPDAGP